MNGLYNPPNDPYLEKAPVAESDTLLAGYFVMEALGHGEPGREISVSVIAQKLATFRARNVRAYAAHEEATPDKNEREPSIFPAKCVDGTNTAG